MNFGVTSVATPKAASSSVARYSFTAWLAVAGSRSRLHSEPGMSLQRPTISMRMSSSGSIECRPVHVHRGGTRTIAAPGPPSAAPSSPAPLAASRDGICSWASSTDFFNTITSIPDVLHGRFGPLAPRSPLMPSLREDGPASYLLELCSLQPRCPLLGGRLVSNEPLDKL